MRDLATAIRLLTVVPLGGEDGRHPARYFSLVGWLFGSVAAMIAFGALLLSKTSGAAGGVVAVLVVAAWGMLSGFLHWDGLADCADGLGARGGVDKRLQVMRESSTGAFGVIAVVLVAAAQIASVQAILESGSWWALAAAPVFGRWSAACALSLWPSARPDGLAARYSVRDGVGGTALGALPLLPLLALSGGADVRLGALLVFCALVALWVPTPFARRFGGTTGDVLGASVLLTETFVLLLGALSGGLL